MLKTAEFAKFLDDFQKSKGVQLGSDVVYNLMDYFKSTYEKYNYTFFELITILTAKKGIRTLNCEPNRSAIIQMINDEKIEIPYNYQEMQPTIWYLYQGRAYTCITVFAKKHICASFYIDDIFQTKNGDILTITNIKREGHDNETYKGSVMSPDNVFIYFTKKDTNDFECEICMECSDFLNAFDKDDLSIIFSKDLKHDFKFKIGNQKQDSNKRQKIA